jgi:transcriptional regulator with XRE-family HTH domain
MDSPHPIDRAIGQRVREARRAARLSQQRLGDTLGVSFQQVQKYESGYNRVSAHTLLVIAEVLQQPVTRFLNISPSVQAPIPQACEVAFNRIADAETRRRVAALWQAIAELAVRSSMPQQAS